jgi:hypothetical protein
MKPAVRIVSLANQLIVREAIGYSGNASGGQIDPILLNQLGLDEKMLAQVVEKIKTDMDSAGAFLRSAA